LELLSLDFVFPTALNYLGNLMVPEPVPTMIPMSYQALLFCPDEKTARIVTQVLSDLEFNVEPCMEPFAAVKRLMAQHFDALVVDCENEQNATLLFKSARNSGSNQSSLAVAVVEGQAGVARAFRIGANLVLTKPINVEQSKGTLRVARGLLRKADTTKLTGAVSTPLPAGEKAPSTPANLDAPRTSAAAAALPGPLSKPSFPAQPPSIQTTIAAAAASSSAFEVEADATPKPEPAEAALLESLPELSYKRPGTSSAAAKEYPWQPVSKPLPEPMASSLRRAAEAAGKTQGNPPAARTAISATMQGAAAAPAPAKESPQPKVPLVNSKSPTAASVPEVGVPELDQPAREAHKPAAVREHLPAPKIQSEAGPALLLLEPSAKSGGGKKWVVVAVVVVAAAASGYLGWMKMHSSPPDSSAAQNQMATRPNQASPATASVPANQPVSSAESAPALSSPSSPATPTDSSTAIQGSSAPLKPSRTTAKAPESASSTREEDATSENAPPASVSPARITVSNARDPQALAVIKSPAIEQPEAIQPPPPAALQVASGSSDAALAGIVSATSNHIPAPSAGGGLKVSQGVVQGLVIKKVAPVYPQQALQMHLQGSVVLQANISKEGKITNVKTISGDALLARAASDAVRQWKYKPYVLNGEAVGIQTEVTVKFTLPN
jgi:protein TonB